jgi:PBP1b-binding outer membrane lipoprotein LpoB
MRKSIYIIMLLIIAAIISGCSGDKSETKSLSLPDEKGKDVSFGNMDEPALVFFFTGVG